MNLIKWDANWTSGDFKIDDDHQSMIQICNRICSLADLNWSSFIYREAASDEIQKLISFVEEHFRYEERLIHDFGLSNRNTHTYRHLQFRTQMVFLTKNGIETSSQLRNVQYFISGWIKLHILDDVETFYRHHLKNPTGCSKD